MRTKSEDTTSEHGSTKTGKKRDSVLRRVLKYALMGVVSLIAVITVANWLWAASGSNEWELAIDKDGTQVYTLKTPGSTVLKVKGVTTTDEFTLDNIIAPFLDESIQDNCGEWVEGCTSYDIIKPWNPTTQTNVTMWTVSLFPPFAPREFLFLGKVSQDPETKAVTLENIAVPNKVAPNDCCVRLHHAHNVWTYSPVDDGGIRIEFISDVHMGGLFPMLMVNLAGPSEIHKMLTEDNPELLRKAKYREADLDFIEAVEN